MTICTGYLIFDQYTRCNPHTVVVDFHFTKKKPKKKQSRRNYRVVILGFFFVCFFFREMKIDYNIYIETLSLKRKTLLNTGWNVLSSGSLFRNTIISNDVHEIFFRVLFSFGFFFRLIWKKYFYGFFFAKWKSTTTVQ